MIVAGAAVEQEAGKADKAQAITYLLEVRTCQLHPQIMRERHLSLPKRRMLKLALPSAGGAVR